MDRCIDGGGGLTGEAGGCLAEADGGAAGVGAGRD